MLQIRVCAPQTGSCGQQEEKDKVIGGKESTTKFEIEELDHGVEHKLNCGNRKEISPSVFCVQMLDENNHSNDDQTNNQHGHFIHEVNQMMVPADTLHQKQIHAAEQQVTVNTNPGTDQP